MQSLFSHHRRSVVLLTVVSSQNSGNFTSAPRLSYTFDSPPTAAQTIQHIIHILYVDKSEFRSLRYRFIERSKSIGSTSDSLLIIIIRHYRPLLVSSMSFEFWTRLNAFNLFSRLIEIGDGFDLLIYSSPM